MYRIPNTTNRALPTEQRMSTTFLRFYVTFLSCKPYRSFPNNRDKTDLKRKRLESRHTISYASQHRLCLDAVRQQHKPSFYLSRRKKRTIRKLTGTTIKYTGMGNSASD